MEEFLALSKGSCGTPEAEKVGREEKLTSMGIARSHRENGAPVRTTGATNGRMSEQAWSTGLKSGQVHNRSWNRNKWRVISGGRTGIW